MYFTNAFGMNLSINTFIKNMGIKLHMGFEGFIWCVFVVIFFVVNFFTKRFTFTPLIKV